MTAFNFQFAARRLRVFDRGVFHFRFATLLLRWTGAIARTGKFVLPATIAQSLTPLVAEHRKRRRAEHELPREIGYVKPVTRQDVALAERVVLESTTRLQALLNGEMHRFVDPFQTPVAIAARLDIDRSDDLEAPVDAANFERNPSRFRKAPAFERLDGNAIFDLQCPPAAR